MKNSKIINLAFLLMCISAIMLSCKKEEPKIQDKSEFTVNSNTYKIDNAAWEFNESYNVYYLLSSDGSNKNVAVTLPQSIQKGGAYTKDVSVNINYDGLPTYSSYRNKVSVTVSEKTDNVISGTFSGTFFYVEKAQTVDVNISGTFTAVKK